MLRVKVVVVVVGGGCHQTEVSCPSVKTYEVR